MEDSDTGDVAAEVTCSSDIVRDENVKESVVHAVPKEKRTEDELEMKVSDASDVGAEVICTSHIVRDENERSIVDAVPKEKATGDQLESKSAKRSPRNDGQVENLSGKS